MNILDLIKEYGEITGRTPGWEKYMSVAEYIEFKKAAMQLIMVDTIPKIKQHNQEFPYNKNQTYEADIKPDNPVPPKKNNVTPLLKQYPTNNQTTSPIKSEPNLQQKEEMDELAIFKSMGAE